MQTTKYRKFIDYSLILLTCIFMYFTVLHISEPDIMEARNFITAKEMVQNNSWIVPTMNGNLRFEKPPLPTWMTAVFMKLSDQEANNFILRLPAAITTTVMIFFIYFIVLALSRNRVAAFITSIVSATTFMIMKVGTANSWDIYPYAFMIMAVYFLIKGLENSKTIYFLLTSVFISASFMSKGPIAFYGMLLPFLIAYLIIYKYTPFIKNKYNILFTVLLTFVLSMIWPLLVYIDSPEIFSRVVKKETNTWGNKHIQAFWYYLHIFYYMSVWMVFSIASVFRKFIKKRIDNIKFYDFSLIWFTLTFILLSLIPMKKERYGLPMYIPMAMLIGQLIYYYFENKTQQNNKTDKILINIHLTVMSILSISVPILFYLYGISKHSISIPHFIIVTLIYIIFFIIFLLMINKRNMKLIFAATAIFAVSFQIFTYSFIEKNVRKYSLPLEKTLAYIHDSSLYYDYDFYTLNNEIDIQNVWRVGKNISILNKADLSSVKFPLVIIEGDSTEGNKYIENNFKIIEKKEFFKTKKGKHKVNVLLVDTLVGGKE